MPSNPVIAAVTTELRHYPGVEHEIHEGGNTSAWCSIAAVPRAF
jgi:hypothetical protein